MGTSVCSKMGKNIAEPVGVACSDIDLTALSLIETTLLSEKSSYYFILDNGADFIYHSQRSVLKEPVSITQAEFSEDWPPKDGEINT